MEWIPSLQPSLTLRKTTMDGGPQFLLFHICTLMDNFSIGSSAHLVCWIGWDFTIFSASPLVGEQTVGLQGTHVMIEDNNIYGVNGKLPYYPINEMFI